MKFSLHVSKVGKLRKKKEKEQVDIFSAYETFLFFHNLFGALGFLEGTIVSHIYCIYITLLRENLEVSLGLF